jgi:hypothetical protein
MDSIGTNKGRAEREVGVCIPGPAAATVGATPEWPSGGDDAGHDSAIRRQLKEAYRAFARACAGGAAGPAWWTPLTHAFLRGFPRVHGLLDAFVHETSGGEFGVPLDETLAIEVRTYIDSQTLGIGALLPTAANGRLLLRQFLYDKLAEYDALLHGIAMQRRARELQLWRRPPPYGVASRVSGAETEPRVPRLGGREGTTLGAYLLSRPTPGRALRLAALGVGPFVPRRRQPW